ncbi:spermatogenesis-associated protein 46 [Rhynchocyon petersi]
MENFSLFGISGPRISCSARSCSRGILSTRATSLPDIAKTSASAEDPSPAKALLSRYQCSTLRHGVRNVMLSPDCTTGDTQSGEKLRRNCTIYRPWFSPYSYFVCTDTESQPEACRFPEVHWDKSMGDSFLLEDIAESVCSSSSSPENTCSQETARKSRHSLDSTDYITSQDILTASKWYPAQQNGYKCVACCRMYPTLHSLKSHIKGGLKEGFSCKVYYRKLKALWGKEQKAQPEDRLASGCCQDLK